MEDIVIYHSHPDETWRSARLSRVLGYLAATLSPIDLKAIKSLHDHEGILAVVLKNKVITQLNQILNPETSTDAYLMYLKQKIHVAWEAEQEIQVDFTME